MNFSKRGIRRFASPRASGHARRTYPLLVLLTLLAGLTLTPSSGYGITLENCIRRALEKNPETEAAALRTEAAAEMIAQARSTYYPRFYLAGNYSVTDNPTQAFMMQLNQRELDIRRPDFNPNDPGNTDNTRFTLGLTYRLYDRGRRGAKSTMAALGKEAAAYQLAAVRNMLIHQVIQGYYSVLQAQALVTVQVETIRSLEENLRVASERYQAGSAVKTDVLNLEVRMAQAREDWIRARNGVQLAIAGLNTAIGEELIPPDGLPAPGRIPDLRQPERVEPESAEYRPELQALHQRALIKEQEYKASFSGYFPSLDAFGSYDVDTGDWQDFKDSYLVGIMAEWDFFDGFRTPAQVRQTRKELQAARKDEEQLRNQLRFDLQRARIQASDAWQRLEVARKSIENARESLRITQVRYKEGAATITDLLTAQVGVTASLSRDVTAYYDYLIALSNLKRAGGELVREYVEGSETEK